MWGQLGLYILTFKFTALSIMSMFVDVIKLQLLSKMVAFSLHLFRCLPLPHSTLPPNWWNGWARSRGTGCVRSEGVDTFEKLLASKNYCLQKGSEGSYVEELLPTAYLSIFSGLWKEFVTKAVAVDPHPILYQYVTNQAFEALIQETFQTSNVQQTSAEPLTYREELHCGM